MTGNRWMFYIALMMLILLVISYSILRIRIEIRKRKIIRNIREDRVNEYEK